MSTPPPAFSQQPQQPQQPVYPQQPPAYAPAYTQEKPAPVNTTVADTNTFALVAIILAFIVPVAGIIFGHMGLNQIKRTGDAGRGLALTAVIYGYAVAVSIALFFIAYIGIIFMAIGTFSSMSNF